MNVLIVHPQTLNSIQKEKDYFLKVSSYFPTANIVSTLDYAQLDILVCVPFDDEEWGMDNWKIADVANSKGVRVYQLLRDTIEEINHQEIRPLSIKTTKDRKKANFTFITPEEKAKKAYLQGKTFQEVNRRLRELGLGPTKNLKK
jgi:hypothetical protein